MRRKLDYITSIVLFLLGLTHTIFTPLFYKTFDLDTLWFAGTGLAFVFLGFLNISRIIANIKIIKVLCLIGNVLGFIYSIMIILKMTESQVFIGIFVLLFVLVLSLIDLVLTKMDN